jgi:hypothetical protein
MLLIATLTITIAGCSEVVPNAPERTTQTTAEVTAPTVPSEPTEPTVDVQANRTAAPVVTTAPSEVQEMRINTEFLEEFGMTLSELEERHGNAVRGEVDDSNSSADFRPTTSYTYFFEGTSRGYTFWFDGEGVNEVSAQRSLPDGTSRVEEADRWGNRIENNWFDGQVKDLFLGMEKEMTIEEFEKAYGMEFHFRVFLHIWNGHYYLIVLKPDDKEIIKPDSGLGIRYYREGQGYIGGW